MVRFPDGLRERIKKAADKNNRSMNAEIIATLEDVYPPIFTFPLSDLEMMVLQWYNETWHSVGWDEWLRFRSGDPSTQITDRMVDKFNFFVVAVFNENRTLTNVIIHNYLSAENGYLSAAFDRLDEDEINQYNRLMTATSATKDDEALLRDIRRKMEPALTLPDISIPKLKEKLKQFAPENVVGYILRTRGILT